MPTFSLTISAPEAIARLFEAKADGRLAFGWSAVSIEPLAPEAPVDGPVAFRDYIMEGFVDYTVHIAEASGGCRLHIGIEGESSRHAAIPRQVRGYLAKAQVTETKTDSA